MRSNLRIFLVFIVFIFCACSDKREIVKPKTILIFSATRGFRHASIEPGKAALLKIGKSEGWIIHTTEDPDLFTAKNLSRYRVVIFLNTTGDVLNEAQQIAFQKYIRVGGSFIGIHSAADTESEWPWYNDLVGAMFESHPEPQVANYAVIRKNHPSVSFMPDTVRRQEEIYNFKSFKQDLVTVLITVDERSYIGGKMLDFHPISWYHNFEGGKAFYTAWGHAPETFVEHGFLQHITGAIEWALIQ